MFKEMRRAERQLSQAETDEILVKGLYGVLSVKGENGYAYGVPLNYVYLPGRVYFHCALEGHKLSAIREDNKVSFCVVKDAFPLPEQFSTKYSSAIVFGKMREIVGDEKTRALYALLEKYAASFMEKGKKHAADAMGRTCVLCLDIEHATGKARK